MGAKVTVTMSEADEGTLGVCLMCGNVQEGCEPDARKYKCEDCGKCEVYGIEEAVMMGLVDVENDDEEVIETLGMDPEEFNKD